MTEKEFNFKDEYDKLKKKYKELPEYDLLNNEFEVSVIDKPDFPSRRIRRRIGEKVLFFCRIVENIIYPSLQNTMGAYEASFFNEEEKEHLMKLHKELMTLERDSLILDADPGKDELDIKYINAVFKKWPNLKKEINMILTKMRDSWQKDLKEEKEKYY